MELPQRSDIKKNPRIRLAAIGLLAGLFAIIVASLYIHYQINNVYNQQRPVSHAPPTLNVSLSDQDLFSYNYSSQLIPYLLLNYSSKNAGLINISVTIAPLPYPREVYLLNWSNACFRCGNTANLTSFLTDGLRQFGVLNLTESVPIVSYTDLPYIQNDSILIIVNGFLPSTLLNQYDNEPLLTYLLQKGTRIIYVGGNFSTLIAPSGGAYTLIPDLEKPDYLITSKTVVSTGRPATVKTISPFFFNASTFFFAVSRYNTTWIDAYNGTIFAFPNNLESWKQQTEAAYDIAKAAQLELWNPPYTQATTVLTPNDITQSGGGYPIVLSPISTQGKYYATIANISQYYGKIQAYAISQYGSITAYENIYYRPQSIARGQFSAPILVVPTTQFNATLIIPTSVPETIEPYIEVVNLNQHKVYATQPLFSRAITPPNFTFYQPLLGATIPPGEYIAKLVGFNDQVYAAAYFDVPQINITLISTNINTSTFRFGVTSDGLAISNYNATVKVNGAYSQKIPVQSGVLTYTLPSGAALPSSGVLSFSFNIFGNNYTYAAARPTLNVALNPQYIDFVLALLVVMIEVVIIKAPIRDEFYIDIPSIPRPKAIDVAIKYDQFVQVFDKLNLLYKWRFMPLSVSEFALGIESNVTFTGIPVMLTYKNVELVLNELVSKGYIVGADDLYAPKAWIDASKHDIQYLATFKKLRLYLAGRGHVFSDLDRSDVADIVTTLHNEKANIIIYSRTSRFKNIPMHNGVKTYLTFLNSDQLEEFRQNLYANTSPSAEKIKIYISIGDLVLVDSDNPQQILT